jgi:phosphoinositide-3-kinase, regulatory subunit 4
VTGIELQRLGIVPQTVFLRHRSDGPRSQHGSRRMSALGYPGKSSVPGTPRSHRALSVDIGTGSGAPFEDLRRRLATINGSSNSLVAPPTNAVPRDPRPTTSIPSQLNKMPITSPEVAVLQQRPGSPTESVLSTTGSAVLRTTARGIHMGSFDQKAAPAVGSSKTNVTGLLEAASKMRSEGSPERSGRSSPTSIYGSGTLRGIPPPRPRALSLLPISSYGRQTNFYLPHLILR